MSTLDLAMMFGTALLLLPLARSGSRITRLEGGLLLAGYIIYIGVLATTGGS